MPFLPATSTVPTLPTGFASTVAPLEAPPPAAADAAADAAGAEAGAAEAGACVAGAWVAGATEAPPAELLQAATRARIRRGAAKARKRMGMSMTSLRIEWSGGSCPTQEVRRRTEPRFRRPSERNV